MNKKEIKEIADYFKSQVTYDKRLSPDYADSFRCADLIEKLIKEVKTTN